MGRIKVPEVAFNLALLSGKAKLCRINRENIMAAPTETIEAGMASLIMPDKDTVTIHRDTVSTAILLLNFFGSARKLTDEGRAIYAEKSRQVTKKLKAALLGG